MNNKPIKMTLPEFLKDYPMDNLKPEEAEAIALFIVDELKKNNDIKGMKSFRKIITEEFKKRGLKDA